MQGQNPVTRLNETYCLKEAAKGGPVSAVLIHVRRKEERN